MSNFWDYTSSQDEYKRIQGETFSTQPQTLDIQTQIKTLLLTSLYNNSLDLGLEICDNCACSSSADIDKIANHLTECIYYFYGSI